MTYPVDKWNRKKYNDQVFQEMLKGCLGIDFAIGESLGRDGVANRRTVTRMASKMRAHDTHFSGTPPLAALKIRPRMRFNFL
jgi:hypothetical protein